MGCQAGLVAALLLVVAGPARADVAPARGDKTRARQLFEDGVKRYNLGEYQAALGRFRAAYEELPDPTLLYNTAQCYRQLGERARAGTLYRSYLRELPDAANADEVRRLIVALDAELLREQVTRRQPPQDLEAPPAAARPPPPWWRHPGGWALGGTGLAVAAVGVGLLGGSLSAEDGARSAEVLQAQRDLHNRANALEAGGWVVTGIGAAALIAGVAVLAARKRGRR
jgi:tetratricopeptide (TPR) repeat protein